jgi:hypothetical protein
MDWLRIEDRERGWRAPFGSLAMHRPSGAAGFLEDAAMARIVASVKLARNHATAYGVFSN